MLDMLLTGNVQRRVTVSEESQSPWSLSEKSNLIDAWCRLVYDDLQALDFEIIKLN